MAEPIPPVGDGAARQQAAGPADGSTESAPTSQTLASGSGPVEDPQAQIARLERQQAELLATIGTLQSSVTTMQDFLQTLAPALAALAGSAAGTTPSSSIPAPPTGQVDLTRPEVDPVGAPVLTETAHLAQSAFAAAAAAAEAAMAAVAQAADAGPASPSIPAVTGGASSSQPPADTAAYSRSVWDAKREVRLPPFPMLGKERGQEPYPSWKVMALASLAAAGLTWVVEEEPPYYNIPRQPLFKVADAVVYFEIVRSIATYSVLKETVLRVQGRYGCARMAWLAVKAHFVHLSHHNKPYLQKKLLQLEPGESESMDSFLNRVEKLRDEYAEYGELLDETLLITHVLGKFPIQWVSRSPLNRPVDSVRWHEAAAALREEDNARRQSNLDHPEALLPLGWSRRRGRPGPLASQAAGDARDPGSSSRQGSSARERRGSPARSGHGAAARGGQRSRSTSPARAARRRAGGSGTAGSLSPLLVCWHCLAEGHAWQDCPTSPQGYKPSRQDRERGFAKREDLLKRRAQSQRDRANHAARVAAQGATTPSEGRASGAL